MEPWINIEPWWRLKLVEEYLASFQSGTPHWGQTLINHLFLSHLPALELSELLAINSLLQWVVRRALLPMISMERMPWSFPDLEGHNLILSMRLNSLARFR